jgi:hypothetical protein
MKSLFLLTLFLLMARPLIAQDAQSQAIGGAATSAPMGIYGIYWNPSLLAIPDSATDAWTAASGFSAFDTSNAGSPILQFSPANAMQSSQSTIQRYQQYLGLFAVKYLSASAGVIYDQELNYLANQQALSFFSNRNSGTLASSYNLNYQQTFQQVANLVISYGMPLPLGTMPVFIGGSLKYQDGLDYQQTSLAGTYTTGATGGYTYTKTSSTSGLGLSTDLGFFLKLGDTLQGGLMFQNLTSNFTWQAQQTSFSLDKNTGQDIPGAAQNVTISTPLPYATKLGLTLAPQGKGIALLGQVSWSQGQTRWRFGLERYYSDANIVVRLGTFADEISNAQLWTIGAGYLKGAFSVDASFVTRSLPNLEQSISLGGALDASIHF